MMNHDKCIAPASALPDLQSGRHSLRSLVGCSHPAAGRSWRNDNAAENIPEPQPCHSSWLHGSRQTSNRQSCRSNSRSTVTNCSQRSTLDPPHIAHHPQAIAQQSTLARRTSTAQSQLQLRGSHCKDSGIPEGRGLDKKIRHNRVLEATDPSSWPASNTSLHQPQTLHYGELLWPRE
jgi:hypothetical protein